MIIRPHPIGCENSSVRYFSTSIPLACAVDMIEYSTALAFAPLAVLLNRVVYTSLFQPRKSTNKRITFPLFPLEILKG